MAVLDDETVAAHIDPVTVACKKRRPLLSGLLLFVPSLSGQMTARNQKKAFVCRTDRGLDQADIVHHYVCARRSETQHPAPAVPQYALCSIVRTFVPGLSWQTDLVFVAVFFE